MRPSFSALLRILRPEIRSHSLELLRDLFFGLLLSSLQLQASCTSSIELEVIREKKRNQTQSVPNKRWMKSLAWVSTKDPFNTFIGVATEVMVSLKSEEH